MSDGEYLKRATHTFPNFSSLRNSLRGLTRRKQSSTGTAERSQPNKSKRKEKNKATNLVKRFGLTKYRSRVKPIVARTDPMSSQSSSDDDTQSPASTAATTTTTTTTATITKQEPVAECSRDSANMEYEENSAIKTVHFSKMDEQVEKIVSSSTENETLKMEHPLQLETNTNETRSTKEILAELSKVSKPSLEKIQSPSQETTTKRPPRPLSLDGAQQGLALEKREHLYKILVIGELGAGKTSIIKRYVHQFFSQHYRATIGVDFALKVLNWDSSTVIRLQLWDIAGQERFGNMTRVYYKEAVGAFVVFDVTRVATFDAVVKWKQDLDSKVQLPDGSPIPCVLLANKCDQQKEGIVNSPGKMDEYCKERGFTGWYETSAKENVNIEEAARFLVHKILQNDQMLQAANSDQRDGDKFSLDGSKKGGNNSGSRDTSGSGKSVCSC